MSNHETEYEFRHFQGKRYYACIKKRLAAVYRKV